MLVVALFALEDNQSSAKALERHKIGGYSRTIMYKHMFLLDSHTIPTT